MAHCDCVTHRDCNDQLRLQRLIVTATQHSHAPPVLLINEHEVQKVADTVLVVHILVAAQHELNTSIPQVGAQEQPAMAHVWTGTQCEHARAGAQNGENEEKLSILVGTLRQPAMAHA
eukprot:1136240-Pelagomonas_calceolata.AAC.18